MSRPQKQTVEYFPHDAKSGRTIYILEAKYGNDGYAFWFKLLELLCDTEGQAYSCENPVNWEFLTAKTRVNGDIATDILNTLAALGAIDPELWKLHKMIWSQNLITRLTSVYNKRNSQLPQRPVTGNGNPIKVELSERKPNDSGISGNENPQSKVKYSKVKESKKEVKEKRQTDKRFIAPSLSDVQDFIQKSDYHIGAEEFVNFYESKGWKVGNSPMKDWKAAVRLWEGRYKREHGNIAPRNKSLGVGEYLTPDGRRTYGTGKATIPMDAPARPSERYSWNEERKNWIMQ